MFLEINDYYAISPTALKVFEQCKVENRERAEKAAIEEVSSYLRGRYDINKIFSATGEERNEMIVKCLCDIVLYNLNANTVGGNGSERREERYELTIKYLEKVQKGFVIPELSTLTGADGEEDINNPIRYGLGIKNEYFW
jgi:phage gp36-like protein